MDAPASPHERVAAMRGVIGENGPNRSGTPWDFRGYRLPRWGLVILLFELGGPRRCWSEREGKPVGRISAA